jgi:hypothetical protein
LPISSGIPPWPSTVHQTRTSLVMSINRTFKLVLKQKKLL